MAEKKLSASDQRQRLLASLEDAFASLGCRCSERHQEVNLAVPAEHWRQVAMQLRDDESLGFQQLIDLCGVDYSAYGDSEWATRTAPNSGFGRGVSALAGGRQQDAARFAVVAHLLSVRFNRRLRCQIMVPADPPVIDSVVDVWAGANWFEREAFDLFGILFRGHPDLRRILTDYGFVGHPFRKDFPLLGEVEMRYDPEQQRVVYQPVSVEPRVLVPRVIRDGAGD